VFVVVQNRNERRSHDFTIRNDDPTPIFFSGDSEHDSARSGIGKSLTRPIQRVDLQF
ncbi:hypothetical protein A2U01_0099474, partial [Trifolium medium]|nr:hypothetical protein [Trifolium medium]